MCTIAIQLSLDVEKKSEITNIFYWLHKLQKREYVIEILWNVFLPLKL